LLIIIATDKPKGEREMTAKEAKKLCKIINDNFGEPFLQHGEVKAEYREGGARLGSYINIKIGRRDVDIGVKNVTLNGSGTVMCPKSKINKKVKS
jgi:hypothetical protein